MRRRPSTSVDWTGRIGGADASLVDYNRGGTPLVEIVTEPDIRSADEAKRFLQLLRQTIVELGISDAEMEKGTLRVDANVSVRPAGSDELRTRTEIKNMNSFNFIARGIDAEVERQIGVWESGGEVEQQTYDFDAATGTLTARRSKEEADDYRYFPEPDLVPVEPPRELVEMLRAEVPEAPAARIRRIEPSLDLERATVLVTSGLDGLWTATVEAGADALASYNVGANNLSVRAWIPPSYLRQSSESSSRRASASRALPSTRRSQSSGSLASAPTPTSRRKRSPTRTSSARSSTGFSRRTPVRWRPTEVARTACSASSSARS